MQKVTTDRATKKQIVPYVQKVTTDGIGAPDPNPGHLVSWCFQYDFVDIAFSRLVIWGSSWGRGFRFHW